MRDTEDAGDAMPTSHSLLKCLTLQLFSSVPLASVNSLLQTLFLNALLRLLLLLFSCQVVSDSLRPHGPQHAGLPRPSLSLGVCSNARPLSRWCHLTTSPSATLFSFGLPSCPADRPMFFQFYLTRTLPLLHTSSNPVLFPRISWGPTQPSLKLFLKISAYYIRLLLSELFTHL